MFQLSSAVSGVHKRLGRGSGLAIVALTTGLAVFCSLIIATTASAATLIDQTTGTPTGSVAFTFGIADDFVVPPGPGWLIDNAHIDVQGGAGDQFLTSVLTDSGGLPPLVGPKVDIGRGLGGSGSVDAPAAIHANKGAPDLPYGIGLLPGHYWLGVVTMGSAPWRWDTQSPQSGSEAAVLDTSAPGNPVWRHLSDVGLTGPDFQFRLDGEPISADASRFVVSPPARAGGGALVTGATCPGPGTLNVKVTSGKKWVTVEQDPARGATSGEGISKLKFTPTAKAKRKFRAGKHRLKFSVDLTYARVFETSADNLGTSDALQSFQAPPTTQTLSLVFKRPKSHGHKKHGPKSHR